MGWMALSCDEFCEDENRTAVVVNFYSISTDLQITVPKMTIRGVGNDSVLYRVKDLSSALCPLNPAGDTTKYIFQNDTNGIDTVTFIYTRHNGFISSECGCVSFAEIASVDTTTHAIRNIKITNPSVTTVSYRQGVINAENIRIYY